MADFTDWKKRKLLVLSVTVVLLVIFVPNSRAMYMEGTIVSFDNWLFLARFCFLSDIGRLRFEVEYPKSFATQNIILYYDEPDQWPAVYPTDSVALKTCNQKESVLKAENHQVINLTTDYVWAGCILTKLEDNDEISNQFGDTEKYDCRAGRSFRSVRERWWYVAVDNCNTTRGLYLKYKLTFTNGDGFWDKHFSADQFGILQTDITFLILFGLLFIASVYVANVLHNRQLLHTTYKMFIVVTFCYVVAMMFFIIFYVDYANDGTPLTNVKMTALAFQALGDGVFLLMLILMGKGYTITRGRISHSGSVKIAVLMCIYTMLYAALFIYQLVVFDPGEVLYLYESPAGFGLIAIRGICWIWFIYAIFFTLKHYPEKGLFYVPFFFFYTLWFLSTPIMILIATFVFPKWWREKVMNVIELVIAFTAQLAFLVMTRPSAANRNFPYHVRTSQIGIIAEPTGAMSNNIDGFTHHDYGDGAFRDNGMPNFTEMFAVTTSNRESSKAFSPYAVDGNKPATGNSPVKDPIYPPSLPPSLGGYPPPSAPPYTLSYPQYQNDGLENGTTVRTNSSQPASNSLNTNHKTPAHQAETTQREHREVASMFRTSLTKENGSSSNSFIRNNGFMERS